MQTYSHHRHTQPVEKELTHKEHMKKIMDEENLDSPQDSVEFLEYVKKHQSKVDQHQKKVQRFSKFVMILGLGALSFMAFRYFVHTKRVHSAEFGGQNHRLGASNTDFESEAYKQTFSYISVAIWGLVVTKAKAGVEAAQNKDSTTVSGLVKKVGAICALIAAASVFQLMGTMNSEKPEVSSAKAPKLQASNEYHPPSYYDKKSSHYMGGAHNVLINYAKESMAGARPAQVQKNVGNHGHNEIVNFAKSWSDGTVSVSVPDQNALGGSHNVAMAVIAEQSRKFKNQQKQRVSQSSTGMLQAMFSSFNNRNLTERQFEKNLKSTCAFVCFMATLAMCVAFYVTLKTYHAHLQKRDQLLALLKNPNARVAAGKKGREVVKKLAEKSKALKSAAKPAKKVQADDLEALIESAKAKKAADDARSELLLSGYKAPELIVEPQFVLQQAAAPVQPQVNY